MKTIKRLWTDFNRWVDKYDEEFTQAMKETD